MTVTDQRVCLLNRLLFPCVMGPTVVLSARCDVCSAVATSALLVDIVSNKHNHF